MSNAVFSLLNASLWTQKNQTIKKYFKQLKREKMNSIKEKKEKQVGKKNLKISVALKRSIFAQNLSSQ